MSSRRTTWIARRVVAVSAMATLAVGGAMTLSPSSVIWGDGASSAIHAAATNTQPAPDGVVWDGVVWDGVVWDGAVWDGVVWDGVVWD
jgi:hypothetical protein